MNLLNNRETQHRYSLQLYISPALIYFLQSLNNILLRHLVPSCCLKNQFTVRHHEDSSQIFPLVTHSSCITSFPWEPSITRVSFGILISPACSSVLSSPSSPLRRHVSPAAAAPASQSFYPLAGFKTLHFYSFLCSFLFLLLVLPLTLSEESLAPSWRASLSAVLFFTLSQGGVSRWGAVS